MRARSTLDYSQSNNISCLCLTSSPRLRLTNRLHGLGNSAASWSMDRPLVSMTDELLELM